MNKRSRINRLLWMILSILLIGFSHAKAVNVTLLVDDGVQKTSAVRSAEQNLSAVLTEINQAQKAGRILTTKSLPMDDFSLKSLLRIWAVTPFYCDDEEVVERAWVFRNGSMMVSHIPLIITPTGEDFGMGNYQEAVVEFDAKGQLTDFRLALSSQMTESMEHCGSVVEKEKQMIILQQVERFRTAYNQKDINTIERMFSDDALIITGNVVMKKTGDDVSSYSARVEYTRQNKQQYISNLKRAFARNKWIDVKFSDIGSEDQGNCAGITRSQINGTMYGVRLRQEWRSSNYSDEGYLFMLWEFPENGREPIIHVRTWQPEMVAGVHQAPDDNISTLSGFDL